MRPLFKKKDIENFQKTIEGAPQDKKIMLVLHKTPPPDVDGISTALWLKQFFLEKFGLESDIFGVGSISDSQAKAVIKWLEVDIKDEEFYKEHKDKYGLIIFCDCGTNNASLDVEPDIVIDHHRKNTVPEENCLIIKKEVGSCAAMAYYLTQDIELKYPSDVATALVVGIATDTDSLTREATVTPYDVGAHRELVAVMDQKLFYRLTINYETPKTFWKCLMNGLKDTENLEDIFIGCLARMNLGEISDGEANNIPRIADGLMRVPGVRLSVVIGIVNKEFIRACVRTDLDISLDQFCKDVFGSGFMTDTGKATGGGRYGAAGADIPLSNRERWLLNHYDENKRKEYLTIIGNSYLDVIKEKYLPNP